MRKFVANKTCGVQNSALCAQDMLPPLTFLLASIEENLPLLTG